MKNPWTRLIPIIAAIVGGIWLTAGGVHTGADALGLLGGFLTAAGYMALMVIGMVALERTLHPGVQWLDVIEEDPKALALFWGAALISFALVTAIAIP